MLYDVVAVNIETSNRRVIASGKSEADAEAIIKMAVMRRGVEDEYFTSVPTQGKGANDG